MLTNLWNKIISIGIYEDTTDREKIKIQLMNQLVIVTIIADNFALAIRFLMSEGNYYRSIITVGITLLIPYLNYKRLYQTSRAISIFIFPIWIAFIIVKYGGNFGESNIFILCILLALIQYDGQNLIKISSVAFITSLAIATHIYLVRYPSEILVTTNPYGHITLFLASIIIAILMISFYQMNIRNHEQDKERLLKSLKIKNNELERFAYITSHDLKEPVRNIGGFAGLLKRKLLRNEEQSHYIELTEEIELAAKRMGVMIESILKFSKLDQEDLPMEEVKMEPILEQFKKDYRQLIQDRNASINYANLPSLYGNKVYLNLLFQNLIENAIKYNKSTDPTVNIKGQIKNNSVAITISDNGIGIEDEFKDYIFEPFRRLHSRGSYEGSGLGLSICKRIVENHAGDISIESKIGKGTQFHLLFPYVPN